MISPTTRRSPPPQGSATALRDTWTGPGAAITAATLFLFALAIRALPWRSVFVGGRVLFHGNDAYYHARRIEYSTTHLPDTLDFDPYINYPHGGEPIWSPLFDLGCALLVRVFVGTSDPSTMDRFLVWIPPLVGALTVACTALVARAWFGARAGWLAGACLALLPAHATFSRIGFVDHHVAVALASLGLLASGMAALATDFRSKVRALARSLALAAALALGLLLWPGMILHVVLLELGLLVFVLGHGEPGAGRRAALCFSLANGLALLAVAPFGLGREWELWGSVTPVVLSSFQPWFFAAAAAGFALYAIGCRFSPPRLPLRRRAALAFASVLGVMAGSALLLPELVSSLADAWQWLARQEPFQATVAESRPLFVKAGKLDVGIAESQLSRAVYLVPVLLASAWWRLESAPQRFLVGWGAGLFVATLIQTRFVNSFSIPLALLAGWWLSRAVSALARAWRRSRGRGALASLARAAVLVWLALPALSSTRSDLADAWRWLRGEAPWLPVLVQRKALLLDVADWLREQSPPTSGYLEPGSSPEYAVLSHWADGHLLEYVARRPTVVDNFGDDVGAENLALSEAYYLAPEAEATRLLERLGARYVIFEHRRIRSRSRAGPDSVLARLYFFDGQESPRSVAIRGGVVRTRPFASGAARRHRLVFETGPKPYLEGDAGPAFKLYEHVAGAHVSGRAQAGARVEARLGVETQTGRRFEFVSSVRADEAGHYALHLPYASGAAPPFVRTAPHYTLSSRGRSALLAVSDEDVLQGRRLGGPDLRQLP